MAVETTPLGFQVPDGDDPIRNGDNVIAANAELSDSLLLEARANIANLLTAAGFPADPIDLNDAAVAQAVASGSVTQAAVDDLLAAQVGPHVAEAIASDPSVVSSAATMAQSTVGLVPVWKASTAYVAGQKAIAPNGDVVSAKTSFTSGVAYNAANWDPSKTVSPIDGYAKLVTDNAGRISEGTRSDGTKYIPHLAIDRVDNGSSVTSLTPIDGYVWQWQDASGRISAGTKNDGTWYIPHLEVNTLAVSGSTTDNGTPWKILIVAGQSNALFKFGGYIPTAVESANIKFWNNTDQRIQAVPNTYGSSIGLEFAREYIRENPGERVLIVPTAVGSTGFRTTSITPAPTGYYTQSGGTWDRTLTSDPVNLYASMISRALAAKAAAGAGATFLAMLWSQGEADRTRLTQAEYSTLLNDLITAAWAALGQVVEVIIGSMTPEEIAANDVSGTLGIAAAHIDQPRITEHTAYVWGPANMTQYNEDIHWSPEGNRIRGKIMATDGLRRARLNVATALPSAPINPRISRSGNAAVIEWDAPFSRATDFNLETSTDSGATWIPQTLSGRIALRHEMTVTSGTPLWARLSTTNEVGTSRKTLEVKA